MDEIPAIQLGFTVSPVFRAVVRTECLSECPSHETVARQTEIRWTQVQERGWKIETGEKKRDRQTETDRDLKKYELAKLWRVEWYISDRRGKKKR